MIQTCDSCCQHRNELKDENETSSCFYQWTSCWFLGRARQTLLVYYLGRWLLLQQPFPSWSLKLRHSWMKRNETDTYLPTEPNGNNHQGFISGLLGIFWCSCHMKDQQIYFRGPRLRLKKPNCVKCPQAFASLVQSRQTWIKPTTKESDSCRVVWREKGLLRYNKSSRKGNAIKKQQNGVNDYL